MANIEWHQVNQLSSKAFTCGHCGQSVASQRGYTGNFQGRVVANIYICHSCNQPNYFNGQTQIPGPHFGNPVLHIPDENVNKLYNEARACYTINAFTSSVMCSRKLLMNIAVSEGAEEGKSFLDYVSFLESKNFIPPKGKAWVDAIRKLGNEANHSIDFKTADEARLILTFTEMLLKFIYEMPGLLETPS